MSSFRFDGVFSFSSPDDSIRMATFDGRFIHISLPPFYQTWSWILIVKDGKEGGETDTRIHPQMSPMSPTSPMAAMALDWDVAPIGRNLTSCHRGTAGRTFKSWRRRSKHDRIPTRSINGLAAIAMMNPAAMARLLWQVTVDLLPK